MSDPIPLSAPYISGNEWKYVKECLDTDWVSSGGRFVGEFERRIAEYTGAKFAVACVNGTSALHISLILAGVKPNDEVIVPTITFIAPINAVRYCGAFPVFMDSDQYYNIDVEKTIEFILNDTQVENGESYSTHTGRRVSAVIPVHVFGNAVRLDELQRICMERNIKLIEDATESLGTKYIEGAFASRHAGTIGELGCLSFNGNKIITTGGGGMILTDNEKLARRAKYLTTQAKDDEVRYVHGDVGYNYRLTNIQAAVGVAQLERLPEFLKTKKDNYCSYEAEVNKIPGLKLAPVPEYADNNYWMYALRIDRQTYGKGPEELMLTLTSHRIESRPLWYLNHMQGPFKGSQTYRIEMAPRLLDETLNIPCSVALQEKDITKVVEVLHHG